MMEKLKPYWIIWTYIANYSSRPHKLYAESPEAAVAELLGMYSEDFKAKAKVYVFDSPPNHTYAGPKAY